MEKAAEIDPWKKSVAAFVEASLPGSPSTVLDVGCGDGWLTRRLAEAGYEARGMDPEAPDGALFARVGLEDFGEQRRFDSVVAVLSLHHIRDPGAAVAKIADLLRSRGTLVVVEFAWDRFDDATARWCLDRLPSQLDPDNWLHQRCGELRDSLRRGQSLEAAKHFGRWAAEEGFHSSSAILEELRKRFREQFFARSPYLFPDIHVAESQELAAIEAGEIQPTGFRFVGQRTR